MRQTSDVCTKIHSFSLGDKVDAMLEDWGADAIASIVAELDPSVGCVLVGSDPHLSYVKVMRACNYLSDEKCIFLVTTL